MGKRGRRLRQILLTTGEDPSLWRYRSLSEALKANIDVLAALVNAGEVTRKPTQAIENQTREYASQRLAER